MAKNPRRQEKESAAAKAAVTKSAGPWVSKRGKKIIALGVGLVVLGFWILTYTDPAGQNWASTVSPALLVLGYAIIGLGIVIPDPSSVPPTPSSSKT